MAVDFEARFEDSKPFASRFERERKTYSVDLKESAPAGVSPITKVERTQEGVCITITDRTHTDTAIAYDGKDGKDGADGKNGKDGINGIDGKDGRNGIDGKDGKDGKDGYTPIKGIDYFDGAKGEKGDSGDKGDKGDPGDSPDLSAYATMEYVDGSMNSITSKNIHPIAMRVYSSLLPTANNQESGTYYYGSIRPNDYYKPCRVKIRVDAYINADMTNASKNNYHTISVCELVLGGASSVRYHNDNSIYSTTYRPIYYHTVCRLKQNGYNSGKEHQIGFAIYNSTNPTTATLRRDVKVEVLEVENCTFTMRDKPILQADFYDTAYYTVPANYDAYTLGTKMTGDANTNNYDRFVLTSVALMAGAAIYRSQLLLSEDGETYYSICNSGTAAPTKTCTTHGFKPEHILYYSGTTTVASGAKTAPNTAYASMSFDARYSHNVASLTAGKRMYLKCTYNAEVDLFYLVPTGWLVQDLPTEDDGYWYVFIGYAYSTAAMQMFPNHPVYRFYNGKIREKEYVDMYEMLTEVENGTY